MKTSFRAHSYRQGKASLAPLVYRFEAYRGYLIGARVGAGGLFCLLKCHSLLSPFKINSPSINQPIPSQRVGRWVLFI